MRQKGVGHVSLCVSCTSPSPSSVRRRTAAVGRPVTAGAGCLKARATWHEVGAERPSRGRGCMRYAISTKLRGSRADGVDCPANPASGLVTAPSRDVPGRSRCRSGTVVAAEWVDDDHVRPGPRSPDPGNGRAYSLVRCPAWSDARPGVVGLIASRGDTGAGASGHLLASCSLLGDRLPFVRATLRPPPRRKPYGQGHCGSGGTGGDRKPVGDPSDEPGVTSPSAFFALVLPRCAVRCFACEP